MKMKSDAIVIDSNFFVAFFNNADSLHDSSTSLMKEIEHEQKVIIELIFAEIGTTLLMRTKQIRLTSDLLKQILSGKSENIWIAICTKKILWDTYNIFSNQNFPHLSFEDCSLVAYARSRDIKKIVTYDKGLRKAFTEEFTFLPKHL